LIEQETNWINIHGLNNVDWLKSIDYFKIDNFMLADILNTTEELNWKNLMTFFVFNIKSLPGENSDNIECRTN
jgi:magnesium transporter